ncbi:MAG: macro domain-containing protein [Thermosynechococcaceae cyanobacterium]
MNLFIGKIEVTQGDITQQRVDATVNAANESLLPGGGVSGAIHRAAGLGLQEECIKLKWCDEGEAKITKGYNLPSKFVIHTVGPVWEGGKYNEDIILAECYRNCFNYVNKYDIKTIAFPSISTGSYGFPVERAANIALSESIRFLQKNLSLEKIIFVCFDAKTYEAYSKALEDMNLEDVNGS